ncbi:GNAT family N-acetyltransferase [Mariniflexile maritimum]|uniref:GNAT family N-acetyltransferase n=1 Tax=Mariniflexile maritimum TaxID=2682493 RepID=UPI0012F65ADE|nr:GNAT family N-acetyltransferase [Mariniflexile maritimum]
MIEIIPAQTASQFLQIEALADTIWREYYIPMVGKPLIDYMLEKFQTAKAIEQQVELGFEYFLITFDRMPVSYIAIKKEETSLFLSKIYVLSSYRGKKIAKKAMGFILEKAKGYQLKTIRLTVNVNNTNSINVYEKWGFVKLEPLKADIGNGFYMDDYVMIKELNN